MLRSCRPSVAFRSLLTLLGLFLLLGGAVSAAAGPDGPTDDPAARRLEILKHREAKAASKQRWAKSVLAAEAAATPNQAEYDVHHYDLDLTLDPDVSLLTGTVVTTAEVTGVSISTMDLDLWDGMSVTAATAGGTGTTFSHIGSILTVDLDRTYLAGENVTVSVAYQGNPVNPANPLGASFGWSSHDGAPMIWTLSEPFGARDWWPCKDLNSDKADSISIRCTVPSDLVVASNGLLQSETTVGDQRTFHWKSNYPIATYLVSLAVHPYYRYSHSYTPQGGGDPMEVQYFLYPDPTHIADVEANYNLTVPMIDYFAQGYGEYPFVNEKYGHADFVWGGGMEHQTITSLGWWSMDIISHELAHQWWGDMVTCDDFHHIWLNEGFATWSEAYWAEHYYDFETYQQYMEIAAYYGPGTIYVEDLENDSIFSSDLSYNKGSWIVHMLRGVLGDADFFAGIQHYRANHLYGSATTEELRDALETVSGQDLNAFFQQWIYGEYFPVYTLDWVEGPAAGEITATIGQVQENTGLFTMPIQLRIETDGGTVEVTVQNSLASEDYVISVPGAVNSVSLDPDNWILCQVQTIVKNPTLAEGVLLVNGVDWATYGAEITTAYQDSTFWGATPITFWDCFAEPTGGYPANLPAPLDHGPVPADVIGDYSTVIWVGNNYNGDLAKWAETPILSYLQAGGNVLLLARRSSAFLAGDLTDYLGVTWGEIDDTLSDCLAVAPGLIDIPFIGTQSYNDVYQAVPGPNTTTLFVADAGFPSTRGSGAIAVPPAGGSHRSDGGRLVHISGRPYRMDHDALRQNVEYILGDLLLEPYNPASPVRDDEMAAAPGTAFLGRNYPNPFNPQTVIPFSLPKAGRMSLAIYDARGRLVRRLIDRTIAAGAHEAHWNGTDAAGRSMPSGTYFARLEAAEGVVRVRGLVLIR